MMDFARTGMGFKMDTLDIGGGFCDGRSLGDVAAAVNAALARHFPVSSGVRVIAEPGRCASWIVEHLLGIIYFNLLDR